MTVVKIKNVKGTKKCAIKIKLQHENSKNCREVTKLGNKMKYLKQNKLTQIVLKNHKNS